jgi:hypothetical protein
MAAPFVYALMKGYVPAKSLDKSPYETVARNSIAVSENNVTPFFIRVKFDRPVNSAPVDYVAYHQ